MVVGTSAYLRELQYAFLPHRVTWSADAATDTLSGLIRQPFVYGLIFLSAIDVVNAYFDNAITPALLCSAAAEQH